MLALVCSKHGIYYRREDSQLSKECTWCKCTITQNEFLEKCRSVHGDKYSYDKAIYTTIMKHVEIKCQKHGYFFQRPETHLRGMGCPKCSRSKGEERIGQYLKNLGLKHKTQVYFDWAVNSKTGYKYKYDFFLEDFNMIIEYDGPQHFEPSPFFIDKGKTPEETLLETQRKDAEKTSLAQANGIAINRISWKNFDNIANEMNKILDIERI